MILFNTLPTITDAPRTPGISFDGGETWEVIDDVPPEVLRRHAAEVLVAACEYDPELSTQLLLVERVPHIRLFIEEFLDRSVQKCLKLC